MPRRGTPTPRRSSPPCRCPIRKRNDRGSGSRATCRRPRTRRPAARFTPAARTPKRTRAVAPSRPRCARSRGVRSPRAIAPRSRYDRSLERHAARRSVLGAYRRAGRRPPGARMDPLAPSPLDPSRLRRLQLAGVACGFTAGAWLGAAEAPTKMVVLGLSPVVISLAMVVGVFLARWSLPALLRGTSAIGADVRQAPHLLVWAILAGCLWAVANTLTIYAIKDIGLSVAFPLWNANSLLGILWGAVFFNELRGAGWSRVAAVLGGAAMMCAGATLLAVASAAQAPAGHAARGVVAALAAGAPWGAVYIPPRQAYLTGMNPLAVRTVFPVGGVGLVSALAFGAR